jgi:mannose-6-phosphate isomerase-like protein (cupin superfamily)
MNLEPVSLTQALSSFDDVYSPRIVTRMNHYDVRIAHAKGEHLREGDGSEHTVTLRQGDVYVVPKGTEHKPSSPDGADILMFEPAQTLTTGDWHEGDVPAHVDSTTGHEL